MLYKITRSNIASIITVKVGDTEIDCIFLNSEKMPVAYKNNNLRGEGIFNTLPEPVKTFVNKWFNEMFSVSIEKRQALIDSRLPYTIEV